MQTLATLRKDLKAVVSDIVKYERAATCSPKQERVNLPRLSRLYEREGALRLKIDALKKSKKSGGVTHKQLMDFAAKLPYSSRHTSGATVYCHFMKIQQKKGQSKTQTVAPLVSILKKLGFKHRVTGRNALWVGNMPGVEVEVSWYHPEDYCSKGQPRPLVAFIPRNSHQTRFKKTPRIVREGD